MRTLKELATLAMDVQDACNLRVVVHSFSQSMTDLREVNPGRGTDFYNAHPVAVLFASKVASLTGCETRSGLFESLRRMRLASVQ